MSSQSSNFSIASLPSVSVLIENGLSSSDHASAPSPDIIDLTDTIPGESSISIPTGSDSAADIESIPPGITLLGRTRKTRCVLYDPATADQFMPWWRATNFAKELANKGKSHSWGSAKRTSSAWKEFQEVAAFPGGQPKVRCSHCSVLLEHPQPKNHGTTAMSRHLETGGCTKSIQNQKDIRTMMLGSEVSQSLI